MLDPDPLGPGGLPEFAQKLRAGAITSETATRAYLARIEALDGRLGAYQHAAPDQALRSARAMDALLAAGTDLGPLMGVPIGIKDLYSVEGMPTTAGTKMDVRDLIGPEGALVRSLKRAGCVILGKTKTVEFALGITGLSAPRGTPVNPWDAETVRVPGGSSSGSGVAAAAGMCALGNVSGLNTALETRRSLSLRFGVIRGARSLAIRQERRVLLTLSRCPERPLPEVVQNHADGSPNVDASIPGLPAFTGGSYAA